MPPSNPGSAPPALIVAAGLGSRLRGIAPSKPLARVRGVPLIQSVIDSAAAAGVRHFVVVTGYAAAPLEAFLSALAQSSGLLIDTVRNPDWTLSNGLSVVAAADNLPERFVLLMSDHLFEPALLSDLLRAPGMAEGVTLAVDRRLDNPLVDLDDVTRVDTAADGAIRRIGKGIQPYDAFDTGVFLATQALVAAIRQDVRDGGTGSISAGMTQLALAGRAASFDIGERFWLDVDDAVAFEHAERLRA